jgi:PAT family beta-lactamase induction signal transducer AmpG
MVYAQLGTAAALFALGGVDPRAPARVAAVALVAAVLSATNDLLTDAYQTDLLEPDERAAGAAAAVLGYRVAMLVSGGLALVLADRLSWGAVYRVMSAGMLIGVVAAVLAPEPPRVEAPRTLAESVAAPLVDFFGRPRALATLVFVTLYRFGDTVATAMVQPFLLSRGFSPSEIGTVNQGLGVGATIAGTLAGGALVRPLGLRRALFLFGALQAGANLGYAALATAGRNHALLLGAITADNLCNGLGIAASVAFLMSLCNRRFSATQFALLTSVSSLSGRLVGGASGWAAERLGWPAFFVATALVALPALALLRTLPVDRHE